VERARERGVGVLIDFHALPGGANPHMHSGTSSGKAGLWSSSKNLALAKKCIVFVAEEIKRGKLEGVIGIQICNEAAYGAKGMWDWYEDVISAVGGVDEGIPIYVSDGWDLKRAVEWLGKRKEGKGRRNPVVIDTHKYYTFNESDRAQSPQQIIARIPSELKVLDGKGVTVVVGEWSCVLDTKTWSRVRPEEKQGLVKEFGLAQSKRWREKTAGSYFWTWKMEWMDGGAWGFVEQVKKGNVVAPEYMGWSVEIVKEKGKVAREKREELGVKAKRAHEEYWGKKFPGKKMEHGWFGEGWDVGWEDAEVFFGSRGKGLLDGKVREGADKIGCFEIWVQKRQWESGKKGAFVWEWEHGFRAGMAAYEKCVGI